MSNLDKKIVLMYITFQSCVIIGLGTYIFKNQYIAFVLFVSMIMLNNVVEKVLNIERNHKKKLDDEKEHESC